MIGTTQRCVLLRHEVPDGSWHFDLMIQRADATTVTPAKLLTFRVWDRIDLVMPGERSGRSQVRAERLADHRPEYLDFEGALTRGRGVVQRLARGMAHVLAISDTRIDVVLDWGAGSVRWVGEPAQPASDDRIVASSSGRPSDGPVPEPWMLVQRA